jgi:UDP-N-acetylmuramate dehydrogenase
MKDKLDEYTLNPKTPLFTKDNYIKIPSAYLIESCGWKGKRRGGVGISDKHSLVLVNYEQVSGDELLTFANHLIDDVYRKTNITLEIEPTLI